MKPSLLFSLFISTSVIATQQEPLRDEAWPYRLDKSSTDVPGDNPLVYCADPVDYILDIDYVNLKPNPPVPGKNLTVSARGTLSQDVEAGTKLFLTVKYNGITILQQEADLCEQLPAAANVSCPVKKGLFSLRQEVAVTSEIPAGKYVVTADVYTEGHGEVVTCLEGTAVFT